MAEAWSVFNIGAPQGERPKSRDRDVRPASTVTGHVLSRPEDKDPVLHDRRPEGAHAFIGPRYGFPTP